MSDEVREHMLKALAEQQAFQDELAVTLGRYRDAVLHLVGLARGDTGGAAVAAQVLLSLYDGSSWQVDLAALCDLDYIYLKSVLLVIRGRVMLSEEPHNVIADGRLIFDELKFQWAALNVNQRYAKHYNQE